MLDRNMNKRSDFNFYKICIKVHYIASECKYIQFEKKLGIIYVGRILI